jgi:hypothetical protein
VPSDSHVFDELKVPFIFVPAGSPEPSEVLEGYTDWIKLPATLEPHDQGNQPAGRPAGGQPGGQRTAPGDPSPSPALDAPQPEDARTGGTGATLAPHPITMPDNPVAAYRRAHDGLAAVLGHPPTDTDNVVPDTA